jgi:hypothetical protein
MDKKTIEPKAHAITSPHIKSLAGKGLAAPSTLSTPEIRQLCASVMEHIERVSKR